MTHPALTALVTAPIGAIIARSAKPPPPRATTPLDYTRGV